MLADKPAPKKLPPIEVARNWYKILRAEVEAKGFKWTDDVERLYMCIIAVCTECRELAAKLGIDEKKGLLVIGNVGTGKTEAFMHTASKRLLRGLMISCISIRREASGKGYSVIDDIAKAKGHVVFDDLGLEGFCLYYGNRIEPVQDALIDRYALFTRHGIKTSFTTNLTPKEIAEQYNFRVVDRLKQMCNVVTMDNTESFRK